MGIYNQTKGTASRYWFGFYKSSYNGCGWIATYNALLMLNDRMAPHTIINRYEKNGAIMGGTFGVRVSAVASFFKKEGYQVKTIMKASLFDKNAKKNTANIIWYWHSSGAHFVAFRWNGSEYIGYNTFNDSSGIDRLGCSINSFLEEYGYTSAVLISIK